MAKQPESHLISLSLSLYLFLSSGYPRTFPSRHLPFAGFSVRQTASRAPNERPNVEKDSKSVSCRIKNVWRSEMRKRSREERDCEKYWLKKRPHIATISMKTETVALADLHALAPNRRTFQSARCSDKLNSE